MTAHEGREGAQQGRGGTNEVGTANATQDTPQSVVAPLVLDLFSGAGGAARGYADAGFRVMGVDLHDMPNYPYLFTQDDALNVLAEVIRTGKYLRMRIAAIHASPPCQASSALTKGTNRATKAQNHINLIPAVRELLKLTGLPYVIENVQGAAVRRDLTLCGEMFGLDVIRHRYFELGNWTTEPPAHVPHRGRVKGWRHGTYFDGPYLAVYGDGGGKGSITDWQNAMGIDWMTERRELAESIPPAFTQFVGGRLMHHLTLARTA